MDVFLLKIRAHCYDHFPWAKSVFHTICEILLLNLPATVFVTNLEGQNPFFLLYSLAKMTVVRKKGTVMSNKKQNL